MDPDSLAGRILTLLEAPYQPPRVAVSQVVSGDQRRAAGLARAEAGGTVSRDSVVGPVRTTWSTAMARRIAAREASIPSVGGGARGVEEPGAITDAQQARLGQFGLESVPIALDGDCLFNALITTAPAVFPGSAGELREELALFLEQDLVRPEGSRAAWDVLDLQETAWVAGEGSARVRGDTQRRELIVRMRTDANWADVSGDIAAQLAGMRYGRNRPRRRRGVWLPRESRLLSPCWPR
jgi:hypothetical protein